MMPVSDVVKHLIIINVLMFFGTELLMSDNKIMLAMFHPSTEYYRPYQIVTYMFMHGSITHLFFNMFSLFMFGTSLEMVLGPKKFLFFYFFTGFGALALYLLVQTLEMSYYNLPPNPVVGASGAIYGLMAGYAMLFPENKLQLFFPPIVLPAKYFVLIFAAIELYLGVSGYNTGVAHFAHLGGALFGVLLLLYWRKFGSRL